MNSDSAMVDITNGSTPCLSMGSTMTNLNSSPRIKTDSAIPIKIDKPERRAEIHRFQDEEGRQHDEFALGEIDRLRRLPQQRKADGDKSVDRPGRNSGYQQLNEGSH